MSTSKPEDSSLESFHNDLRGANVSNFANIVSDNSSQLAYQANLPQPEQALVELARELQNILEKTSKSQTSNTASDRMKIAAETVHQIEANPNLMARILSALRAGSISSLEEMLNHPAASFVIAAIEDWRDKK